MKIGLIFDNRKRSETTGFYCRRALGRLADVEHLLPAELENISTGLFDLFVIIDDGLDYAIPDQLRPRAAWAIDTHMDLPRCVYRFGCADWVFAAQKNGAGQMHHALGRQVEWLPLACDPDLHHPLSDPQASFDVGFVGHVVGHRRQKMLAEVREHFPRHWIGQAFHTDMLQRYSQFKVALNCSVDGDVNMRVFEALACGIPLVTDAIADNGLQELFQIDEHLLCFEDEQSLIHQIRHLLENENLRKKLAERGRQHVLTQHTYEHRMQILLERAKPFGKSRIALSTSPPKSTEYFEFDRPDVAALVPETAQRILDVGCGGGRLGATLKSRQACLVTGIELSPQAAQRAGERIDGVIEGAVDDLPSDVFPNGNFDCIIFADVLEHLRSPLQVLRKCRHWLHESGSIVVSVPNNRHHSIIRGLVDGNWTYEGAGLLDDDHVRCFTGRELEKLLFRAGFEAVEQMSIPGEGYQEWRQSGKPERLDFGHIQVTGLPPGDMEEFFIYQHLARAQQRTCVDYGLTSIVIVTHNQLAYTRLCVDSIRNRTDEAYELVFVDNGSSDGTPEYLESLDGAIVINNSDNRGFAPAVNQGLRVAKGRQVLLLNNDTVVTTGWLEGLLEALYDRPDTGLVGPVSNQVSGRQQIPVTYENMTSLDGFAWERRKLRQMTETNRLVGFCLLLRREVIERIGLLDEQFEVGCYEDDDLCRRALQVGYKAFIACHVFVHHFGSVTFRAAGFDFEKILTANRRRYDQKWREDADENPEEVSPEVTDIDTPSRRAVDPQQSISPSLPVEQESETSRSVGASLPKVSACAADHSRATSLSAESVYRLSETPSGGQLLRRRRVQLSLCMIVRDNEDTIAACLESIYPWVDELIVVDTGSVDRTPEICRQFGAQVFNFPWCDDFSAARNASLAPARGDWIFWMDSDDILPEQQGRKLRELVLSSHTDDTLGYVMQVHCPSGEPEQMTVVDHVKMFRNIPELRFEHRIHEQILPAIRRADGKVQFTDIHVVHTGSRQTPEVRQRKLDRDFRILNLDLQRYPDHPFVLFNLGMTCEDAGRYEEAEEYFCRCIAVSGDEESHLRKAWALRVSCWRALGNTTKAIDLASTALEKFPGDKELLFRRAILHQDSGQLTHAVADYERILQEPTHRVFQSFDPAICSYKAQHNLAVTLQNLGRIEEAIAYWEEAIQHHPEFTPAWLGLFHARIKLKQLERAEMVLNTMREIVPPATYSLATGLLCEARGDVAAALEVLEAAWENTHDIQCLDELARILVSTGRMDRAILVLQRLREARPKNAAILHNLGAALHATDQVEAATPYLEESLELRPDASHSSLLLADAYRRRGHPQKATDVLRSALQWQPNNEDLKEALHRNSPS